VRHDWPVVALSVGVLVVTTLVWSSGEDMSIGWLLLVVPAGWGLLALHRAVTLVRAAREGVPRRLRPWAVGTLGCMVALVGTAGICAAGWPEDVRVRVSRGALVDAGERVLAGEHPIRAGLYGFSGTTVSGDCALLETGAFMIDSFGIAYCPAGAPSWYEPLGGALYEYSYD
jgi:hypothetical protein